MLFYLRKQCQESGLGMESFSALLQGKMSALHQRSLYSACKEYFGLKPDEQGKLKPTGI